METRTKNSPISSIRSAGSPWRLPIPILPESTEILDLLLQAPRWSSLHTWESHIDRCPVVPYIDARLGDPAIIEDVHQTVSHGDAVVDSVGRGLCGRYPLLHEIVCFRAANLRDGVQREHTFQIVLVEHVARCLLDEDSAHESVDVGVVAVPCISRVWIGWLSEVYYTPAGDEVGGVGVVF